MDVEETNAPMASAANYNGTSFTRRRLRADRFPPPPKAADDKDDVVVLRGLRVIVADPSEAAPQLETDESYMLEVLTCLRFKSIHAYRIHFLITQITPAHPQIPLPPSSFLCLVVATLRARTVHGALRGLESFSQLVVFDWASSHRTPAVHRYLLPAGAPLLISDAPRFPWRGLLVDTGRHFQPVAHIKVCARMCGIG